MHKMDFYCKDFRCFWILVIDAWTTMHYDSVYSRWRALIPLFLVRQNYNGAVIYIMVHNQFQIHTAYLLIFKTRFFNKDYTSVFMEELEAILLFCCCDDGECVERICGFLERDTVDYYSLEHFWFQSASSNERLNFTFSKASNCKFCKFSVTLALLIRWVSKNNHGIYPLIIL